MTKPRVIVIGAGFGGLFAVRTLAKHDLDILLIDRNNFHTFTPLLYQVATCALDPSAIAYPVRSIFRDKDNVHFMLGEVTAIDMQARQVTVQRREGISQEGYDYLIVAGGSVTNSFGQTSIQEYGFGMKDLDDALKLRHHVLRLFEQAAWMDDAHQRDVLTTIVVVGGGATGIETAGAMYELYNYVLRHEFDDRHKDLKARVILLEASDRLLAPYPERLRLSTLKQLEALGVEVWLNAAVQTVTPEQVVLRDGRVIETQTLVWSAGVKASPLAEMLGVELQRAGHVPVKPNLQLPQLDNVYVIGDMAYLTDEQGNAYPMVIQVAQQQGKLAARNILRQLRGEKTLEHFRYRDLGLMATIGRSRAVAWLFNRIQLSGFVAWLGWLFLHLITLLGFRNRISVFVNWVWNYLTYDRSVRLILDRVDKQSKTHEAKLVDRPELLQT